MMSVRKYCSREDELAVRQLFFKNAANSLNKLYFRIVSQEVSFQVFLLVSAISFVSFDIPLHYCFAIPLLGALILYLLFWCGHYKNAWEKIGHLKKYSQLPDNDSDVHLAVMENVDGILGTLGIEVKVDPDMKEPPGTVAWINKFTLLPQPFSQRESAARELLATVVQRHCLKEKKYEAIEMILTEDQEDEKYVLEKQGFHINKVINKKYFGMFKVTLFRYRLDLSSKEMLSSA